MAAEREAGREQHSPRARVFEILEHGRRREPASRAIDWLLIVLVVANVVATVAHTVPNIASSHGTALQLLDRLCMLVFTVEYLARIWVAPEHPLLQRYTPTRARLRFAATPLMAIDALALLPLLLELLFPRNELVLLTRLVRFLKLARYSPALATLGRLIASERRALLACVIIFTGDSAGGGRGHVRGGGRRSARQARRHAEGNMVGRLHAGQDRRRRVHSVDDAGAHHRRHHGDGGDHLLRAAGSNHRPRLLRGDPPS